jgi:hypothetical protein
MVYVCVCMYVRTHTHIYIYIYSISGSRDSVIGIAHRYGLGDPGFETRWGPNFPYPSRPVPRPTQPPVQRDPGLFPEGEAAGAWL